MNTLTRKLSTSIRSTTGKFKDASTIKSMLGFKPKEFQKLPWNIVQKIIEFIRIGYIHHANGKARDDHIYLKPLFHVSHNWRAGAMQASYSVCNIVFGLRDKDFHLVMPNWPLHMKYPETPNNEYVSELSIFVDSSCVYSGVALKAAQSSKYINYVFNNAYTLKINYRDYYGKVVVDDNSRYNAQEFIDYITGLVPNVVTVEQDNRCKYLPNNTTSCVLGNELMRGLYAKANKRIFEHNAKLSEVSVRPHPLTGLTDINCEFNEDTATMIKLIQSNFESLKQLAIAKATATNMTQMVLDNDSKPVVFSQLCVLKINAQDSSTSRRCRELIDVSLFPVLKQLKTNAFDILPEHALFYGNKQSLELLNLEVDDVDAKALNVYDLFGKLKFFNLRNVRISSNGNTVYTESGYEAILSLAFSAGAGATVLSIAGFSNLNSYIANCLFNSHIKSIQVLRLGRNEFKLDSFLAILKALPSIRYLYCGIAGMGDDYENTKLGEVFDNMILAYHPLNTSLLKIYAKNNVSAYHNSVAKCALVLSLLCPELQSVEVSGQLATKCNSESISAIEQGNVSESSIQHLHLPIFSENNFGYNTACH